MVVWNWHDWAGGMLTMGLQLNPATPAAMSLPEI
jgi:hypothetical protein